MSLDLNSVWFVVVGALFTGYAVLDGFDLGVGALHLFSRGDRERRVMLNSIGPVWDGNEVWLVTAGGALFAAFPEAYATAFSGFYLAFMLLLAALIFRAVAIEFRSKKPWPWWREAWDWGFSLSSVLSGFLAGLALGNLAWGIPLDASHEYSGTFLGLLNPYALLVGVSAVALFMMHGAIYVVLKTEGSLQRKARVWVMNATVFFIFCYILTTMATLLYVPRMSVRIETHPLLFIVPLTALLAIANIPRETHFGRDFRAFLSSCAAIVLLLALFGIGLYPDLIPALDPAHSLDITNAASSPRTLRIMLVIACVGMPLVLAYTAGIYWVFRGKVKLKSQGY